MGKIALRYGGFTQVDDDMEAEFGHLLWRLDRYGYAVRELHRSHLYLHRIAIKAQAGQIVDHINGERTDNRRCNLRLATQSENQRNRAGLASNNSSGFTGVHRVRSGRWVAIIRMDGERIHLGTFGTIEEAVSARRAAEIRLYRDFAPRTPGGPDGAERAK